MREGADHKEDGLSGERGSGELSLTRKEVEKECLCVGSRQQGPATSKARLEGCKWSGIIPMRMLWAGAGN